MKIIGHRGARALAPENTLASLRKALEHGVDEIECDVRVTRDGVVVLHHDADLVDAGGTVLLLATHDYEELKAHKPDLCTLAQAIEAVDRQVPLQIEVKPAEPVRPIVKIIENHLHSGWQPVDLLLGSKSQKTLRELHHCLPAIEKVVIEPWSGLRATHRARQVGTKRLSMKHRWLWSGFIRAMRRSGYQLAAYTLDDPSKARRWQKYGLWGVITDSPDRFESSS